MIIEPIKFNGTRPPKNSRDITNRIDNTGFTAPLELPLMVRLFDKDHKFISIGRYGQIGIGGWELRQTEIPNNLSELKIGHILFPFGNPQWLRSCGTHVKLWNSNDIVYIDFMVKSYDKSHKYFYQVQFPLKKSNVVQYHYYHVTTGYNTIVGAKGYNNDYIEWLDFKDNWPYSKVALEINTSAHVHHLIDTDEKEDVVEEKDNQTKPIVDDEKKNENDNNKPVNPYAPIKKWKLVYENSFTKLLIKQ